MVVLELFCIDFFLLFSGVVIFRGEIKLGDGKLFLRWDWVGRGGVFIVEFGFECLVYVYFIVLELKFFRVRMYMFSFSYVDFS